MTKSADEEPKKKTAKRVVAEKRLYFLPNSGESVLATSAEDAATSVEKAIARPAQGDEKDVEDGDGE